MTHSTADERSKLIQLKLQDNVDIKYVPSEGLVNIMILGEALKKEQKKAYSTCKMSCIYTAFWLVLLFSPNNTYSAP